MSCIQNATELRGHYGEIGTMAARKVLQRLDAHAIRFIGLSPFLVLASAGPDGSADASPRGDPPGFVRVLDEATLFLPDRPGNNRVDSFANVLAAPGVGLIFFVPGVDESLRVNGTARVVTDPALLEDAAVNGKPARAGLLIAVHEVFFHCGKALKRARLWDPATQIPRAAFPSLGQVIADQTRAMGAEEADRRIEEGYRTRLY